MLHFARLDAFPVLDSAARMAVGLPAAITLPNYVDRYRPTFLAALDALRDAGDVDPSSPTLLRRFDKILYQYGLELGKRTGCR